MSPVFRRQVCINTQTRYGKVATELRVYTGKHKTKITDTDLNGHQTSIVVYQHLSEVCKYKKNTAFQSTYPPPPGESVSGIAQENVSRAHEKVSSVREKVAHTLNELSGVHVQMYLHTDQKIKPFFHCSSQSLLTSG